MRNRTLKGIKISRTFRLLRLIRIRMKSNPVALLVSTLFIQIMRLSANLSAVKNFQNSLL